MLTRLAQGSRSDISDLGISLLDVIFWAFDRPPLHASDGQRVRVGPPLLAPDAVRRSRKTPEIMAIYGKVRKVNTLDTVTPLGIWKSVIVSKKLPTVSLKSISLSL